MKYLVCTVYAVIFFCLLFGGAYVTNLIDIMEVWYGFPLFVTYSIGLAITIGMFLREATK